jgi:hypothetical protein
MISWAGRRQKKSIIVINIIARFIVPPGGIITENSHRDNLTNGEAPKAKVKM